MIDEFFIFDKGGLILWSYKRNNENKFTLYLEILNKLIQEVFLEDRLSLKYYEYDIYRANWIILNDKDLILVVIYQGIYCSISSSLYIDKILTMSKKQILKILNTNYNNDNNEYLELFRSKFDEIIHFCDIQYMTKSKNLDKSNNYELNKNISNKGKKERQWNHQKITKKAMEQLDYSLKINKNETKTKTLEFYQGELESDEFEEDINTKKLFWNNWIINNFGILQNNTIITKDIIYNPLQDLKSRLIGKNVAPEIAENIIQSINKTLIGVKVQGTFTKLNTILDNCLRDTITRILSPKKIIDVLNEAIDAKNHGQIYSIVFLGVNGVGKSTNLAKVCYYLKNKGNLKVMIVACDTFRAGAIEQLKTHANCLDVYLYEKGYGKDAAFIAKDAILYAKENKYDIVLIDTAGRMQDNAPLMKSLAKLVMINNPNLVIFVGEALVGNDAVNQLQTFNKFLIDHANRSIDGILLTKFDTVDDKVGAALSMVYSTGQPIIFIGTGQKYFNLKILPVSTVVNGILK
ncbi:putative signal recognition particle receptor subunit alpha [Cryptosporidium serpentis]